MELKIAVCDDDIFALDKEYEVICSVLVEQQIDYSISKFNSPNELMKSGLDYHIVCLDIEMGNVNGIKVAEALHSINGKCLIFFVTNYAVYMDEALNHHAFRFWTKPIEKHRLIHGINSAMRKLNEAANYIDVIVHSLKTSIFVDNIIYLYANDKRVYLVTTKGKISVDETYKSVCDKLKEYSYFCENYRGELVNFKFVSDYEKGILHCNYKEKIYERRLSRRKYDNFNKKILDWIGGK